MSDKNLTPVVLALGYFDSVHKGHQKVIESAKTLAKEKNVKTVVFTFSGNLKAVLGDDANAKVVYTDSERKEIYLSLGVDEIYFAPSDLDFLSLGKLAFLNMINRQFNIVGYACGADYRFGRFGKGSPMDIERFAKNKNQTLIVNSLLPFGNEKISTTLIKRQLASGQIEQANVLLGRSYSVSGEVVHDRKVGAKLGFPTVNIIPDKQKQPLKCGVYGGHVIVDKVKYKAIINYGSRPTFYLEKTLVETHLIGFDGDLYGKNVTVYFDVFLRDIKKFKDTAELIEQLILDLNTVKGIDI